MIFLMSNLSVKNQSRTLKLSMYFFLILMKSYRQLLQKKFSKNIKNTIISLCQEKISFSENGWNMRAGGRITKSDYLKKMQLTGSRSYMQNRQCMETDSQLTLRRILQSHIITMKTLPNISRK